MASPQEEKAHLVKALLLAKESSAQLFHRQAPLPDSLAKPLLNAVPQLGTNNLLESMKPIPMRSCDPSTLQDPTIYRFNEAVAHNAESIKKIINEEFGDGIMSAVGFYCSVEKVKGKDGEDRVAVVFNGKFLPHVVQRVEDNTAKLQKSEKDC
ncbi:hypothetical protein KP509_1Z187900 [Ceratopteris richardii]|nr:hypothetical protein KP509_1Z187900 [Ceratopteris richardii]